MHDQYGVCPECLNRMELDPATGRINYHRVIRYPVDWWLDDNGPAEIEHRLCPGSNLWPCLP